MIDRRTLIGAGLSTLAISAVVKADIASAETGADAVNLDLVLPELRPMASAIAASQKGKPSTTLATLTQAREAMSHAAMPLANVPWRPVLVPGTGSQPDIPIYVINAAPGQRRPAIVHTHGGGFITGTARSAIPQMQSLAEQLGCLVITVEYRLAPETTFAGSIADNYAALKWAVQNAELLGIDPKRIAVMGESAGGGHAALLALTARDRGEIALAFQCLTYPMLDDRTATSRNVPAHIGQLLHRQQDNRFCWRSFLGTEPGTSTAPSGAVPARIPDLAGLPPTFLGVGGLDLFIDEDIEYARRLTNAAVPVELIVVPGAFHVFDGADVPISRWFNAAKVVALRRGLCIASA